MKTNFTLTLKEQISNIKLLPLLASAVTLSLSVATISPAFAQSTTPDQPIERDRMHGRNKLNKLNLTPEQQEQMQRIKQSQREQINNILTPEQKARLEAARENRENRRQVFESLNLTEEQQAQIQEVRRASKQQMESILTPEQVQQLRQYRQRQPEGTQRPS